MKSLTRHRTVEFLELLAGSVLPIIFWVSVIFGFDTPCVAILTIIAAVIHELGHYLAIACFSAKGILHGHSSGFRIKRQEMLSYTKEIAVLLAGPGMNIAFFAVCAFFADHFDGYIKLLGYINLVTGLSNLLPLEGYDGYGAIMELLHFLERDDLTRRLETFSFTVSVCLTFISLYLIDRFSEGYWIFGLFFVMTLSKLANFGKYDIFGK